MLKLPEIVPDDPLLLKLSEWQQEVDAAPAYPDQVKRADAAWTQHRQSKTLTEVAALLDQMCCGGRRCAYCEDSLASDVEHIWPKRFYPDLVFNWLNYLYACGPCNSKKGDRFAVYSTATGKLTPLRRKKQSVTMAPPQGSAVFINPREEDPTQFFRLDLRDSFQFKVRPNLTERDTERADFTLVNLPLNEEPLCKERENEYGNYLARLEKYEQDKARRASLAQLDRHRTALLRLRHQTVWFEMKSQHQRHPELQPLFASIPEVLSW